jgi:hypothetical protein
LVRLRIIIEKLRPLDLKLKYQIDKLLKLAITGLDDAHEADPLAFKPGLGNLVDEDESESDDEGLDGIFAYIYVCVCVCVCVGVGGIALLYTCGCLFDFSC